jgi:alkanesulfonate monooxygenase SsuD/methylene tetrahydromethanopterin reductase-like flavin-dependent oxidoreductase (luciferase family)
VPPLLPWDVLEGPLDIYKEACAKAGNSPDILYLRPVYLGDDEAQIRREAEEAVHNFLKFNASPIFSKPPLPPKEELIAKGYGFYASGALEGLTELSYDDIVDGEIGFIGTPNKVIDQIGALREKGGIGELTILTNFGGIDHWKAIKTQELFAEQVMPAFR